MTERLLVVLERARDRGFLGPGPVESHIEHARAFLPALEGVTGTALDLGAGGGVPGLVLAVERADLRWILLDATARRTAFLAQAAEELDVAVTVRTARAEAVPDLRGSIDVVVARGFGPPAVTAECAAPLLRVGGRLVVSEPPGPPDPGRWAGAALVGLGEPGWLPGRPGVVVLEQVELCPARYPRRVGVPTRRPLWQG